MKISELPLNEYKNVSCYDQKTGKVTIPEGFVITTLTMSQLKMLGIETVKAHIGFEKVRFGRRGIGLVKPKLVNIIPIENEQKALDYITKVEVRKKYRLSKHDLDWLFK